jgi:hypothetical protein
MYIELKYARQETTCIGENAAREVEIVVGCLCGLI